MKLIFIITHNFVPNSFLKIAEFAEELDFDVVGFFNFADNSTVTSLIGNYPLYPWTYALKLDYDFAVVDYSGEENELVFANISKVGVPKDKLVDWYWLLQRKMIYKYEDSPDPVIQETLAWWKTHRLTVFNQHLGDIKDTYEELLSDGDGGLPYVWFETVEGKKLKMYYPRQGHYSVVQTQDGKRYSKNLFQEQLPTSPHLYITGEHKVKDGDVLIDAGVCEGNFALKYVDVCSRIYLFEPDPVWLEPLNMTFKDYANKVVLIPKFVSNFSRGRYVAIDDVVNIPPPPLDIFLKADVEGAEIDALHGAKKLLQRNKVKASICSYHHADDLWKIKSIFKQYNYKTWTSEGYMVFIYGSDIFDTGDFRRGIVYAEN